MAGNGVGAAFVLDSTAQLCRMDWLQPEERPDFLPWLLEEQIVTQQEEQMLTSLVERVNATKLTEKDPDAAALLQRGFSANPDAVYILAQSVLVQNIALEHAHAQLSEAQGQVKQLQEQQAQQPAHSTSFLGSLLGHRDPAPPPPPPPQPAYQPVNAPPAQGYQTPYNPPAGYGNQGYGNQGYAQQQYVPVPANQPSFLRSAAETAVGVAAGALLFEGVEDMLYGGYYRRPAFGYGYPGYGVGIGGWGMPGIGFGMGPEVIVEQPIIEQPIVERPVEETVVNNNYFDSNDGGGQSQDSNWNDNSGSGYDNGSDSDDSGGFDSGSGGDSGGF